MLGVSLEVVPPRRREVNASNSHAARGRGPPLLRHDLTWRVMRALKRMRPPEGDLQASLD
jgi:hypothetical protein